VAHTLFEFDSVDFAVAIHRFNLAQVTPHMPGYILHVLLGQLILNVLGLTSNDNAAFVTISILLSMGSVLFLWRAVYWLRGERVALIAAILWLTNPLFWFYGEVATVYPHEAFFASTILYLGIALFRRPNESWIAITLGVFLSLATGARESSLIFFLPALLYLFIRTNQSKRTSVLTILAFAIVTLCWALILFSYSGGLGIYLHYAGHEKIYRSQSFVFGNSLSGHLAVMVKILLYLLVGALPILITVAFAITAFPKWLREFAQQSHRKPVFTFTALVAAIPLLFYFLVYFMKAGYLLNVLPSLTLCEAVLLDQCAIWLARKRKQRAGNAEMLTRRLITRNSIIMTSAIVLLNLVWFFAPLPGKSPAAFNDEISRESFGEGVSVLYPSAQDKRSAVLNKLFAYSSIQSVKAMDAVNNALVASFSGRNLDPKTDVVLTTWWSRMAYYYLRLPTFEIHTRLGERLGVAETNPPGTGPWIRKPLSDSMIYLTRTGRVLLLMRADHPSMAELVQQVHLKQLPMPQYLDLYEITDSTFSFIWDGVRFVKD
jgi:hypothetical protein